MLNLAASTFLHLPRICIVIDSLRGTYDEQFQDTLERLSLPSSSMCSSCIEPLNLCAEL